MRSSAWLPRNAATSASTACVSRDRAPLRSTSVNGSENVDGYRRKVANLHEALEHEDTKAEATEIIRNLIDEIVLVPENGELRIDLKGELAGILALATDKKKPAEHRDGLEQIKLVAGARNQRYLHIAEGWLPRAR